MTGNHNLARLAYLRRRAKRHVRQVTQAPDTTSNEGDTMKHPFRTIALVLVGIALLVAGVFTAGVIFSNLFFGTNYTAVDSPSVNSDPILTDGDPQAWNKPMESGQMTTLGLVTYTQTGKPGEQTVTGYVGEGQNLVVTAYRSVLPDGELYDNGIVYIVSGPFDLNEYPLTIVDGAATLVAKGDATQAKIDSMWVDFCRGDRTEDGSAWTYRPWALSNVFLPDDYFMLDVPGDCFNSTNDSWPNNPPVPVP